MSFVTDLGYVSRLESRLRNFKQKTDYLWNFSCPLCGDSTKKKSKTRGYIYRHEDSLNYKCHNCFISIPFSKLLERVDLSLYNEYRLERYKEWRAKKQDKRDWKDKIKSIVTEPRPVAAGDPLADLPTIASLPDDHPAKVYIVQRQIPEPFHHILLWAEDFAAVVDRWKQGRYALIQEPRIVIPFRDGKGRLLAIQGRCLPSLKVSEDLRYITVKADDKSPKLFGLDRIDQSIDRIYVVEGPFDSMFLPNAIACAGSDLPLILPRDRCIVAYDNEPRNAEIVHKIRYAIAKGFRVVVWPDKLRWKDINDMIVKGKQTPAQVLSVMENHSYSGETAKREVDKWRMSKPKQHGKYQDRVARKCSAGGEPEYRSDTGAVRNVFE